MCVGGGGDMKSKSLCQWTLPPSAHVHTPRVAEFIYQSWVSDQPHLYSSVNREWEMNVFTWKSHKTEPIHHSLKGREILNRKLAVPSVDLNPVLQVQILLPIICLIGNQ